jgi:hypothetical protein
VFVASSAEWAAVGSAIAAALAATASWAAVWQTRKFWSVEHAPDLQLIALVEHDSRQIILQVHSAGGGFARDVVVLLVEGDQYVVAYGSPNGVLLPGRGVQMETPLLKEPPLSAPLVGVVIGADISGTTHAWAASGAVHRRWTRDDLRKKAMSNIDIFHAVVPGVNLNELKPTTVREWKELS